MRALPPLPASAALSYLSLLFSLLSALVLMLALFPSTMNGAVRWMKRLIGAKVGSITSEGREHIDRLMGRGWAYAASLALPVFCLIVMVGASVYVPISNRIGVPVTEMHNVYVLETVGPFGYWLRDDTGRKLYATFCDSIGYEPPFDKGQTIVILKFRNIGTCWDMRDMHPKYVMLRDQKGDLVTKEN